MSLDTPVHALDELPITGAIPPFHPPLVQRSTTRTGLPLWHVQRGRLPLFSLRLVIDGGSAEDPAGQEGLVALSDGQLTRGAGAHDAIAVAELLDRAALRLTVATSARATTIALEGHSDRLEMGLELLAAAVNEPRFEAAELERARALRLGDLVQDLDDPDELARNATWRALFGDGHPLSHPPAGTRAGVAAVAHEGARESWVARRQSRAALAMFCGALPAEAVAEKLSAHLSDWANAGAERAALPLPSTTARRQIFIDKPGSTQSVLSLLASAPGARHPSLHAARIATIGLGGTFTSRLNQKLREEKGYTYGVSCQLQPAPEQSVVAIRSSVQGEVTGAALSDLMAELERLNDGLTMDEIARAALARRTQLVSALETSSNLASSYASLWEGGRDPDGFGDEIALMSALSEDDVRAGARSLDFGHAVVVVVGDLSAVRASVEAALPGDWELWPATT